MPAFVRTPRDEQAWAEAKQAAAKQGLSEEHGDGYWKYVNAVFQRMKKHRKSQYALRDFIKARPLSKALKSGPFKVNSGTFSAPEAEPHEPQGSLSAMPPRAMLDGHALVQRPDHKQAVAGRVIAVGKHGIHLRSDDGKVHKVRHEHVLDHRAAVSQEDPEWPEAAQALHQQGIPMDVEERFRKPTAQTGERGVPKGAAEMLQMLEDQGVPVDTKRLLSEGTPDEIEEVLSRYVNLDPKPSQLPTALARDRIHQAPGWEKVFPEGGGRVSRQPSPPKREYADDNDTARDEAFDAIKETGMVEQVNLNPEIDPEEQEHVLRVAANTLKSLAQVIDPPEELPELTIVPANPDDRDGEPTEEVGAHYDRRSNRIEVGLGMPESIAHAWGHVIDASLGGGKYASLKADSPVGRFVAEIHETPNLSELGNQLGADNGDEGRRFWMRPDEVFARFFEQWVDHSVGQAAKPEGHHSYVRGVDQPGQLDEGDVAGPIGQAFRKLIGSRDRSNMLKMGLGVRKETSEQSDVAPRRPELAKPIKPDDLRHHLMEEAKGHKGEVGKRLVAGLAHGLKPEHLERAPGHYDAESAAAHAGIFARARKRVGNGREDMQMRGLRVRGEEGNEEVDGQPDR